MASKPEHLKPITIGWKKYFTLLFWRIQIDSLIRNGDFNDNVEIIDIPEGSDLGMAIKLVNEGRWDELDELVKKNANA